MKKPLKDRKIVRIIQQTTAGENKAGQILHGTLDILPLPNQFLGKAVKAIFAGEFEQTKQELKKAFTLRNIVAIIFTIALVMGWIEPSDVEEFSKALNEVDL